MGVWISPIQVRSKGQQLLCWVCGKKKSNQGTSKYLAYGLGCNIGRARRRANVDEHHGSAPCSRFASAIAVSIQKWSTIYLAHNLDASIWL